MTAVHCAAGCQCGRHKPKTPRYKEMMAERNRDPQHIAAVANWHRGRKRSHETRARIAAKARGRPSGRKGKPASAETRAKLSLARRGKPNLLLRGRVMSPETRAKIGAANRGRKQTPEHIAKKAAARTGKKNNCPLGPCAICGEVRGLYKDHCHVTGHRRGMLCIRCNTGIGQLQDSPEILEKAAAYIRAHRLKLAL